MDFYVIRALEVARLTPDQLKALHTIEQERGICVPVQENLKLGTLKACYGVPDSTDRRTQTLATKHWRKCRERVEAVPELGDFGMLFRSVRAELVANVHSFDWKIHTAVTNGDLEFRFGFRPRKRAPEPTIETSENQARGGGRGRLLDTDIRTAAAEGYRD